jgi:U1 small nuclear ribonucleoprotein
MFHLVRFFEEDPPPPREKFETPQERRTRVKLEKKIEHEAELDVLRSAYSPEGISGLVSDPYKTLFVGRLAYETTERTLRRVFEEWGRVSDVKLIHDRQGNSRGYAFIEYESERDFKDAYKFADGIKIDGRHILVDVERGRTVPGWLPRRLGGGRGPGRVGYDPRKQKRAVKPNIHKSDTNRKPHDRKRGRSPDQRSSYNKRGGDYRHQDSRYSSRKSSYNY